MANGEEGKEPQIVGGESKVDAGYASSIAELLKNNLHKLKEGTEAATELALVKVEDVTSQVVGGMMYRVTAILKDLKTGENFRGKIKIYERKWEDFLEVTLEGREKLETNSAAGSSSTTKREF